MSRKERLMEQSIRAQIYNAVTVEEVEQALAKGAEYRDAKPATERSWKRAAEQRRKELR